MGLVLWIDQNTMATNLIQRVFKQKNLPFYELPSVVDFSYLVEDLRPSLIVLDNLTFKQNPEVFKQQYGASELMRSIPFVLLDNDGSMNFIERRAGDLKRPLEPFRLPEILNDMLERL
jgi:hypothetical protein